MVTRVIPDSDGEEYEAGSGHPSPEPLPTPLVRDDPPSSHGACHFHPSQGGSDVDDLSTMKLAPMDEHTFDEENQEMDPVSFDQGPRIRHGEIEMEAENSLRDVPSSPPSSKKPQRLRKQDWLGSSKTSTKMTRGLKRQLNDIGYISEDDELNTPHNVNVERRKKGRFEEEVDPAADYLASALPVPNDAAFVVAPTLLSASQKEEYATIHAKHLSSPRQPLSPCRADMRSSGTSTNVNTPRSDGVHPTEPWSPGAKSTRSKRARAMPTSSSAIQSVVTAVARLKKTKKKSGAGQDPVTDSDREFDDAQADACAREEQEQSDASYGGGDMSKAGPSKDKKRRGRPKKTAEASSTKEEAPSAETKTNTKTKKKRGRPKKSETTRQRDEDDAMDQGSTHANADAALQPQDGSCKAEAIQTEHEAVTQSSNTEAISADPDPLPRQEAMAGSEDKTLAETKNQAIKAAMPTASRQDRPSYRVGLSKRTRIAPLLKMIRK